jgi:hypothetical protein
MGRPIEALLHPPAVDDVADQIDGLAVGMVEEVDQHLRVAAARAEMNVRDPDSAKPPPFGDRRLGMHRFGRMEKIGLERNASDGVHGRPLCSLARALWPRIVTAGIASDDGCVTIHA